MIKDFFGSLIYFVLMFAFWSVLSIITNMAENDGSSFPKFQMFINKQERWLPLHEAGRMYDYGYAPVEIGEQVYDDWGVMRPITDEERQKIVDIADEWSENK